MINSFGTGKRTEADGSGRRRSGSSPAKGPLFEQPGKRSAVRAARQQQQDPPQHPGRRIGERSEAPPAESCSFVVLQCCCLFVVPAFGRAGFGIAAAGSTAAAPRKAHWRAERSPTAAGASSSRIQQLSFSCAVADGEAGRIFFLFLFSSLLPITQIFECYRSQAIIEHELLTTLVPRYKS